MRPAGAAAAQQQQQGQPAEGVGHHAGGPGTPTAPSPHGGMGRTPGSGNRERPRGPRGMHHEKRGSGGEAGHGLKSAGGGAVHPYSGSAPATPPGVGAGEGEGVGAAVSADGHKDEQ